MAAYSGSNVKALIGGTYHGLGAKHLQVYLDEFAQMCARYRFGRRIMLDQIVDRCIPAVATRPVWTYRNLVEKVDPDDVEKHAEVDISTFLIAFPVFTHLLLAQTPRCCPFN